MAWIRLKWETSLRIMNSKRKRMVYPLIPKWDLNLLAAWHSMKLGFKIRSSQDFYLEGLEVITTHHLKRRKLAYRDNFRTIISLWSRIEVCSKSEMNSTKNLMIKTRRIIKIWVKTYNSSCKFLKIKNSLSMKVS